MRRAKTLGGATAEGEFHVVTLRTRFDAQTVAPWRDNRTLPPNPRARSSGRVAGRTL